jgi:hypothetical protein
MVRKSNLYQPCGNINSHRSYPTLSSLFHTIVGTIRPLPQCVCYWPLHQTVQNNLLWRQDDCQIPDRQPSSLHVLVGRR